MKLFQQVNRSRRIARRIVIAISLLTIALTQPLSVAHAAQRKVAFFVGKTACAKRGRILESGTADRKRRFTSFTQSIKSLKRTIARTPKKKRAPLNKRLRSLEAKRRSGNRACARGLAPLPTGAFSTPIPTETPTPVFTPTPAFTPTPTPTPVAAVATELRIGYLVPSDRAVDERYRTALVRAAFHSQQWLGKQLGGRTVTLHPQVVDVLQGSRPSTYYSTNPSGERAAWFINNSLEDARQAPGASPGNGSALWMYYIDADAAPEQTPTYIGGDFAVLSRRDLEGLLGRGELTPCRWTGEMAHTIGHLMGFPDWPECSHSIEASSLETCTSLMAAGSYLYPDTYLTEPQKSTLLSFPLFSATPVAAAEFDCRNLEAAEPAVR